jgi:hypothetical protein
MPRARRLASLAAVAILGLTGLAACRSAPDVAVYLGDRRVTNDRVDQVVDAAELPAAQRPQAAESPAAAGAQPTVSRQQVVDLLVSLDLAKRIAKDRNISVDNQVTAEQVASELQIARGSEYATAFADWINTAQAIMTRADTSKKPTDQQILAVYDGLVKARAIDPGLPLDQVKQAFGDARFVTAASSLGQQLSAQATASHVTVNPRFLPLAAPMFVTANGRPVFYQLPYVAGSGAVTDRA